MERFLLRAKSADVKRQLKVVPSAAVHGLLVCSLLVIGACSSSTDSRLEALEAELVALEEAAERREPNVDQSGSTTSISVEATTTTVAETTSTTSTSTTSSTTTTTTLPNSASELSLATFEALAEADGALDYSKQIETPCGLFAMTVLPDRLRLYQWDGSSWFDQSDLLGPDGDFVPSWVKSHDFTGDGVLDMFVHYRDPYDNSPIGAMFWQDNCTWGWATFLDSGGSTQLVAGLGWNASRGDLLGSTVNWDGYKTYFLSTFDPSLNAFVLEDIPFSPPPSRCVEAVSQIRRFNSADFLESWWGSDYIRFRDWWGEATEARTRPITKSLEKCRRDDWLTEVERWRSSYNNHADASYYQQSYVLLSNEVAADVLKAICGHWIKWFEPGETRFYTEFEGWQYAFRSYESVACD